MRSPWAGSGNFNLSGSLFYDVSIAVPIIAFLFDRIERRSELNLLHLAIDLIVVGSAIGRVVGNVPFVSGHTLFLTYAIISTRSLVVRIPAIVLLTQAVYLKYFVWHDFVTASDGIILGAISGLLVLKFGRYVEVGEVVPYEDRLDV